MDRILEYYKQFVDREELRANLKLTIDERLHRLQQYATKLPPERQPPGPDKPWEPISDCRPERIADPVIELYKRDIDRTLLRENLRRSASERFQALASMARLLDEFQANKGARQKT